MTEHDETEREHEHVIDDAAHTDLDQPDIGDFDPGDDPLDEDDDDLDPEDDLDILVAKVDPKVKGDEF